MQKGAVHWQPTQCHAACMVMHQVKHTELHLGTGQRGSGGINSSRASRCRICLGGQLGPTGSRNKRGEDNSDNGTHQAFHCLDVRAEARIAQNERKRVHHAREGVHSARGRARSKSLCAMHTTDCCPALSQKHPLGLIFTNPTQTHIPGVGGNAQQGGVDGGVDGGDRPCQEEQLSNGVSPRRGLAQAAQGTW